MTEVNECAKCSGTMHRGFLFDRGHNEYKTQQAWVEGDPEESFWSGLRISGRDVFYTTEPVDL